MGQQIKKVIKRRRREGYLKRKKELAKLGGIAGVAVATKQASKKETGAAVEKKPAAKKTAKKAPAKKAAKKAAKPEAEAPETPTGEES